MQNYFVREELSEDLDKELGIYSEILRKLLFYRNIKTKKEAEIFLKTKAIAIDKIRTSEDVVLSQVGIDLYEKFFRGYTCKQWGLDPSELESLSQQEFQPEQQQTIDILLTPTNSCL